MHSTVEKLTVENQDLSDRKKSAKAAVILCAVLTAYNFRQVSGLQKCLGWQEHSLKYYGNGWQAGKAETFWKAFNSRKSADVDRGNQGRNKAWRDKGR